MGAGGVWTLISLLPQPASQASVQGEESWAMPQPSLGAFPPSEGPTGAFPDSASRGRSSSSFALSPNGLISGRDRRMPGAAEGDGAGGGGGDLRE